VIEESCAGIAGAARSHLQLQLNRCESRHEQVAVCSLPIVAGDAEEIMNKASCLGLLSNAVLVWNTLRIGDILERLLADGHSFRCRFSSRVAASALRTALTASVKRPVKSVLVLLPEICAGDLLKKLRYADHLQTTFVDLLCLRIAARNYHFLSPGYRVLAGVPFTRDARYNQVFSIIFLLDTSVCFDVLC